MTSTTVPFATWLRNESGSWSLQALLRGRLVMDDGCLYVAVDRGPARRVLPVFPDGATWDNARHVIRLGEVELAVGDEVKLGGGEVTNTDFMHFTPPGCDTSVVFQVFDFFK